jgi:L-lactate dehydrogenase complex protein LldG
MSSPRDRILGRVHDAMRKLAPAPAALSGAPIFSPVVDLELRFRQEFLALKGEILDTREALREFLDSFRLIATDGGDLVRQAAGQGNSGVRDADLGVTGCDCLIAQLGAIVVTPRSAGGRALSVLPTVHLVVARRDQILPDLAAAIAFIRRCYDGRWPSTLSIIAGPSRTGDIEKIIVMGAHGPRRLVLHWAD